MDTTASALAHASALYARASSDNTSQPPVYKAIGVTLAVSSGVFIGSSFVLKKTGLLKANVKYNEEAGEGYGYLKNAWWWSGMILMIVGEICNFVAYAFVDAILVTPMGALSVVVTTILSAIFLKERLSFVGKVGCFNCIVGSVIIALNAPQQSSVSTIQEMQHYVIAPGFLTYAGIIVVGCAFVALWAGPRYGKRSMFVYLTICSLIGGLSVVATQGLGAAILAQIRGVPQFNQWFLYVLLGFVIVSLLTEIIYLNKALNIFNAALVTPTYYVFFTSATIVTSAILFQGFAGSVMAIVTMILGFFQICSGVVLLQLSKSAKDVPDAAIFKGDLDQIREVSEIEQPESEPKADAIRGTAAIIRRISVSRQKMEEEEVKRYFRERHEDQLKPPAENEIIEWDGLRRRKTVIGEGPTMAPRTPRTPRSPHPPLGMSRFPVEEEQPARSPSGKSQRSFLGRASSMLHPSSHYPHSPLHPVALTEIAVPQNNKDVDTAYHGPSSGGTALDAPFQPQSGRERSDTPRSIAWADEVRPDQPSSRHSHLAPEPPPHSARRQFSFHTVFNRIATGQNSPRSPSSPGRGILKLTERSSSNEQKRVLKHATEEERLGLVKGDSRPAEEEDYLDEKIPRSTSPESFDSTLEELETVNQPYARPHQASTASLTASSISTTAFPPYEDHHPPYHTEADTHFISVRQVSSPEHDGAAGQWPRSRSTHHQPESLHSSRQAPHRPPPYGRPARNSLPPIPAEEPAGAEGGASSEEPSYVRVEMRSPDRQDHSSSELGVTSLSSSSSSSPRRPSTPGNSHRGARRDSSWRREPRGDVSSRGSSRSNSGSRDGDNGASRPLVRGGAFI
ncbi:hypothetical protein VTN77DRAFT_2508 [Rasamsonia byssochlamydoides]|uniref:uncharacterized protein n=1 Tax=Rasamsonia byssochlamydoides TaxID=89139 RepID=UPI0037440338